MAATKNINPTEGTDMKTIEINKNNWTGELVKLRIKKDMSFEVHDYKFRVERTQHDVNNENWDTFIVRSDEFGEYTKEHGMFKGFTMDGAVYMSHVGCERENQIEKYGDIETTAVVTAAQIIFNTV